ncbi:GNAT family N-acetyltransferase [Halobacillus salinus]|uniref:N-acetyltransferase n=1 Tax=Halobacillus salinus TaxID=192814 RepID=A0A4Z0H149_9BACI|nr:GNAT family N-acetyltransferase [Halobacillus salinus]TGB03709.1 N-acetyltransferase [Halobacillus salinus]
MEKLHAVKFREQDFNDYYRLVSNQAVMAQITERAIPLEEAQANFEKLLVRNGLYERLGSYKIYEADTNDFVGLGHLTRSEESKEEAEIGYMILPEHWGKKYGTEVARMLIELAEQTELQKLMAIIDPANRASRKILVNQKFASEKVCEMDGLPAEILYRNL